MDQGGAKKKSTAATNTTSYASSTPEQLSTDALLRKLTGQSSESSQKKYLNDSVESDSEADKSIANSCSESISKNIDEKRNEDISSAPPKTLWSFLKTSKGRKKKKKSSTLKVLPDGKFDENFGSNENQSSKSFNFAKDIYSSQESIPLSSKSETASNLKSAGGFMDKVNPSISPKHFNSDNSSNNSALNVSQSSFKKCKRLSSFPSIDSLESFGHFNRSSSQQSVDIKDVSLKKHEKMRQSLMDISCFSNESEPLESNNVALFNQLKDSYPSVVSKYMEGLDNFINKHENKYQKNPIMSLFSTRIVDIALTCRNSIDSKEMTSSFFYSIMEAFDKIVAEINETVPAKLNEIMPLIKELTYIISQPFRLVECLEYNPKESLERLNYLEENAPEQIESFINYFNDRSINLLDYADPRLKGNMDQQNPSANKSRMSEPIKSLNVDDFDVISRISKGHYGTVFLVRMRNTDRIFAMKKIDKCSCVQRNQFGQLFAERDIHFYLNSPYIVRLYCTFVTANKICFLLHYVSNGDLEHFLNDGFVFNDSKIKKMMAQLVLAIEFLHSKDIVHRDLKPANILLTSNWNIKLTDFGLSEGALKHDLNEICNVTPNEKSDVIRFVGTTYYIAPEVLYNKGYSTPIDWWALGIILYELQVGCPPFVGETPPEIFEAIMNETHVWFPDCDVDKNCCDFVDQLLEKQPEWRLGTAGVEEVKSVEYFSGVDFEAIRTELEQAKDIEFYSQLNHRFSNLNIDSALEEEGISNVKVRNNKKLDKDDKQTRFKRRSRIKSNIFEDFSFMSPDMINIMQQSQPTNRKSK